VSTPSFDFTEVFDDSFLDKLLDLVEQTRSMQDETFNYSVIKLIVRVLFIFGGCFGLKVTVDLAE
jgi:hypothetical protein